MSHPPASQPDSVRAIPIYVCTPQGDMQAERDLLRQAVFPELNARCRELNVQLTPVNWRPGGEGSPAQERRLPELLRQIESARPWFVAVLGDCYGEPAEAFSAELLGEFPRLEQMRGASVPEIELRHGGLHEDADATKTFFYFRDERFLRAVPPELRSLYSSEQAASVERLEELKDEVRQSGRPLLDGYPCNWDAEQQAVCDLEEFGKRVLEDLYAAVCVAAQKPVPTPEVGSTAAVAGATVAGAAAGLVAAAADQPAEEDDLFDFEMDDFTVEAIDEETPAAQTPDDASPVTAAAESSGDRDRQDGDLPAAEPEEEVFSLAEADLIDEPADNGPADDEPAGDVPAGGIEQPLMELASTPPAAPLDMEAELNLSEEEGDADDRGSSVAAADLGGVVTTEDDEVLALDEIDLLDDDADPVSSGPIELASTLEPAAESDAPPAELDADEAASLNFEQFAAADNAAEAPGEEPQPLDLDESAMFEAEMIEPVEDPREVSESATAADADSPEPAAESAAFDLDIAPPEEITPDDAAPTGVAEDDSTPLSLTSEPDEESSGEMEALNLDDSPMFEAEAFEAVDQPADDVSPPATLPISAAVTSDELQAEEPVADELQPDPSLEIEDETLAFADATPTEAGEILDLEDALAFDDFEQAAPVAPQGAPAAEVENAESLDLEEAPSFDEVDVDVEDGDIEDGDGGDPKAGDEPLGLADADAAEAGAEDGSQEEPPLGEPAVAGAGDSVELNAGEALDLEEALSLEDVDVEDVETIEAEQLNPAGALEAGESLDLEPSLAGGEAEEALELDDVEIEEVVALDDELDIVADAPAELDAEEMLTLEDAPTLRDSAPEADSAQDADLEEPAGDMEEALNLDIVGEVDDAESESPDDAAEAVAPAPSADSDPANATESLDFLEAATDEASDVDALDLLDDVVETADTPSSIEAESGDLESAGDAEQGDEGSPALPLGLLSTEAPNLDAPDLDEPDEEAAVDVDLDDVYAPEVVDAAEPAEAVDEVVDDSIEALSPAAEDLPDLEDALSFDEAVVEPLDGLDEQPLSASEDSAAADVVEPLEDAAEELHVVDEFADLSTPDEASAPDSGSDQVGLEDVISAELEAEAADVSSELESPAAADVEPEQVEIDFAGPPALPDAVSPADAESALDLDETADLDDAADLDEAEECIEDAIETIDVEASAEEVPGDAAEGEETLLFDPAPTKDATAEDAEFAAFLNADADTPAPAATVEDTISEDLPAGALEEQQFDEAQFDDDDSPEPPAFAPVVEGVTEDADEFAADEAIYSSVADVQSPEETPPQEPDAVAPAKTAAPPRKKSSLPLIAGGLLGLVLLGGGTAAGLYTAGLLPGFGGEDDAGGTTTVAGADAPPVTPPHGPTDPAPPAGPDTAAIEQNISQLRELLDQAEAGGRIDADPLTAAADLLQQAAAEHAALADHPDLAPLRQRLGALIAQRDQESQSAQFEEQFAAAAQAGPAGLSDDLLNELAGSAIDDAQRTRVAGLREQFAAYQQQQAAAADSAKQQAELLASLPETVADAASYQEMIDKYVQAVPDDARSADFGAIAAAEGRALRVMADWSQLQTDWAETDMRKLAPVQAKELAAAAGGLLQQAGRLPGADAVRSRLEAVAAVADRLEEDGAPLQQELIETLGEPGVGAPLVLAAKDGRRYYLVERPGKAGDQVVGEHVTDRQGQTQQFMLPAAQIDRAASGPSPVASAAKALSSILAGVDGGPWEPAFIKALITLQADGRIDPVVKAVWLKRLLAVSSRGSRPIAAVFGDSLAVLSDAGVDAEFNWLDPAAAQQQRAGAEAALAKLPDFRKLAREAADQYNQLADFSMPQRLAPVGVLLKDADGRLQIVLNSRAPAGGMLHVISLSDADGAYETAAIGEIQDSAGQLSGDVDPAGFKEGKVVYALVESIP